VFVAMNFAEATAKGECSTVNQSVHVKMVRGEGNIHYEYPVEDIRCDQSSRDVSRPRGETIDSSAKRHAG
jgi:hypothetical protein